MKNEVVNTVIAQVRKNTWQKAVNIANDHLLLQGESFIEMEDFRNALWQQVWEQVRNQVRYYIWEHEKI